MSAGHGDIIQITQPTHHWHPCLLVVDSVYAGGVLAYALIPRNDGQPTGHAYLRVRQEDYEIVGRAVLVAP